MRCRDSLAASALVALGCGACGGGQVASVPVTPTVPLPVAPLPHEERAHAAAPALAPAPPPVVVAAPPAPPASPPLPGDEHLVVSLERTACYGHCPIYAVAAYDDGTVVWRGKEYVSVLGERRDRVDPKKLAALAEEMRRARFFDWDDTGRLPPPPRRNPDGTVSVTVSGTHCTDVPHAITTLRYKGKSRTLHDEHCSSSAPLRALEDRIDLVLGTRRWIGAGDAKK